MGSSVLKGRRGLPRERTIMIFHIVYLTLFAVLAFSVVIASIVIAISYWDEGKLLIARQVSRLMKGEVSNRRTKRAL